MVKVKVNGMTFFDVTGSNSVEYISIEILWSSNIMSLGMSFIPSWSSTSIHLSHMHISRFITILMKGLCTKFHHPNLYFFFFLQCWHMYNEDLLLFLSESRVQKYSSVLMNSQVSCPSVSYHITYITNQVCNPYCFCSEFLME